MPKEAVLWWLLVLVGCGGDSGDSGTTLTTGSPTSGTPTTSNGPTPTTGTPTAGARVATTLFYISDDGMQLVEFERRLEQRAEPAAQARVILEAQLAEVDDSGHSADSGSFSGTPLARRPRTGGSQLYKIKMSMFRRMTVALKMYYTKWSSCFRCTVNHHNNEQSFRK